MGAGFIFPLAGNGTSSTKDKIILILSHEWPLSSKQIYDKIVKETNSNVTYQAVHKTIRNLLEQEIIVKEKNKYKLNKDWIGKIKNFATGAESVYNNGQNSFKDDSEKPVLLSFNCLNEVGLYIIHDFHSKLPDPENKEKLCSWAHTWPAIGMSNKEYDAIIKLFSSGTYYAVTKYNTFLDNYFSDFLVKVGKKSKTGIDLGVQEDTFVHGDYIGQLYFEPEFRKEMHKFYKKVSSLNGVDIAGVFKELLGKKTKLNFLLFKNKELADQLRKEVLKHFEGGKNGT